MRRRNLRSTSQLDGKYLTHDFRELAKELRIAKCVYEGLEGRRRRHADHSAPIAAKDLHQAWRYGVRLDEND